MGCMKVHEAIATQGARKRNRADRKRRAAERRREAADWERERKAKQPGGTIKRVCPHCEKTSKIPAKYSGRRGRCPKCKEEVRVPED